MDISIEEIRGVLAEDDQGPYWLTIRKVYRTEEGLVIVVSPKKKPVHMALLENDDDYSQNPSVNALKSS